MSIYYIYFNPRSESYALEESAVMKESCWLLSATMAIEEVMSSDGSMGRYICWATCAAGSPPCG